MDRIDPQPHQHSPQQTPDTVTYFWVAAIEKPNGEKFHCHATAEIIPGVHTRASVTKDILAFLGSRHDDFVLLSLSLEPNKLGDPRPAVAS